jgi:hypothetical protein
MDSNSSARMKRKSPIETVPPGARDFTVAVTAKPRQPEEAGENPSDVWVSEPRKLLPQTFRLPQRLIDDLARAGELRALLWMDREGNTWLPSDSGAR